MRRLVLIPLALLGLYTGGAFASIKQATNTVGRGTIISLDSSSITVGRHRHPLTCALTTYSPATGTFVTGNRVKIACSHDVLVAIADVSGHRNPANGKPLTIVLSGRVTNVGLGSITVHDGRNTLSCTVGPSSPTLTGLGVGAQARIGCRNGVLVSIDPPRGKSPPMNPGPPITKITIANGPIARLGSAAITVETMTCRIGPRSPGTSGFRLGESVRMYCLNGVLNVLRRSDAPPPPPPTTTSTTTTGPTTTTGTTSTGTSTTTTTTTTGTTTTTTGTTTTTTGTTTTTTGNVTSDNAAVTALSSGSITVGTLTCQIGAGSPSTSAFKVGDVVLISCTNGMLSSIALDSF